MPDIAGTALIRFLHIWDDFLIDRCKLSYGKIGSNVAIILQCGNSYLSTFKSNEQCEVLHYVKTVKHCRHERAIEIIKLVSTKLELGECVVFYFGNGPERIADYLSKFSKSREWS